MLGFLRQTDWVAHFVAITTGGLFNDQARHKKARMVDDGFCIMTSHPQS